MGSGRNLLFLAHTVLNIIGLAISQPDFLYFNCFEGYGNYTTNSIYQTNLNTLLSSLSSNTDSYGFVSSSLGEKPDSVHANVLCRGDADLDTCRECINASTSKLTQDCPNSKEAVGWYDDCMLRYSNKAINGTISTDPDICMANVQNASNMDQFNQVLRTLFDRLTPKAASGGIHRKFATGNETGPDFQNIYGLMQCTPDLSEQDCTNCLQGIMANIPNCCAGKRGGRVITPSCKLDFEDERFFTDIPADAPPPKTGKDDNTTRTGFFAGKDDNTTRMVVIIVVSAITSVITLIVCIYMFLRKRKQKKPRQNVKISEAGDGISTLESLHYNFDTIKVATDNFSNANKLGQGGFGDVYKGKLQNGQEIAVKRLSKNSRQGELEFMNETMLVARLQHRNLVRLLGFCLEGTERLLIYEIVTNSSLDHFIFDPTKRALFDWERRYKIIGGVARGLLYLHEDSRLRIIHRDLKASNILLDADMNSKISDFGMARLFGLDETQGNTSRIVGTYGYMAPEYAMHGQFSVKSDVFSFGVLVLEIVTGERNNCFRKGENIENLLSHAWKSWTEGSGSNLIDPSLRANSGSMLEIMRCIHIGLLCVQENLADRPTMASVVLMLNSSSLALSMPTKPAFFLLNTINLGMSLLEGHSKSKSQAMSIDQEPITELHPR